MTPNQSAGLKFFLLLGVAGLLVLVANNVWAGWEEERAAEARRVEEKRKENVALAAAQIKMLEQLSKNKADVAKRLVQECTTTISRASNSIYAIIPDRKDHAKVRKILANIRPYDIQEKIDYIALPRMDEQTFLAGLVQEMVNRQSKTGEVVFEFSATWDVDTIFGLQEAWGIVVCPFRGGKPDQPKLDGLYME